jgi:hypothetical protein
LLFCRPSSNFFAYCGKKREVSNGRAFPIPHPPSVTRLYGDGAYDTASCRQVLAGLGIEPIIPPHRNAVMLDDPESWRQCRDNAVAEMQSFGRLKALSPKLEYVE